MKGIYFEEKGIELLGKLGVTKAEFARRMGIQCVIRTMVGQ